jgi:hypothetical protein
MPFACLRAQHRMRPEISVMMRPIYNNLIDHESVLNFENIKGISKNIFFIDHQANEVIISHKILKICKFSIRNLKGEIYGFKMRKYFWFS